MPCRPSPACRWSKQHWPIGSPPAALDGVSTYWLGQGPTSAVSLFTLRYPDRETAARQFQSITDALATCDGNQLTVGRNQGLLTATPVSYENGVQSQLGYLVKWETGDRYAISVLQYANTITWQFRLEFGNQPYRALRRPAGDGLSYGAGAVN